MAESKIVSLPHLGCLGLTGKTKTTIETRSLSETTFSTERAPEPLHARLSRIRPELFRDALLTFAQVQLRLCNRRGVLAVSIHNLDLLNDVLRVEVGSGSLQLNYVEL